MTRLVSVGAVQPRQRMIARPRKQELNDVIRNTGGPPTTDQGGAIGRLREVSGREVRRARIFWHGPRSFFGDGPFRG